MSLFLDCFKNISVFLDWYVQGCSAMHVIRSFRNVFIHFWSIFWILCVLKCKCACLCERLRGLRHPTQAVCHIYIVEFRSRLSIIIVTLAEAVESVLLSLKIVTDLQFYLFFLINLLSSNHLILLPANYVFGIYTLAVEVNNLSLFLKNAVELIS